MKNKGLIRKIIVAAALGITIVVNVLSNLLPFNDITAPELAAQFDVYFVPAGYVFSIWSIIYLGLLAYAVFQLLPSQRDNSRLQQIAGWFVLSCLANSIWLILWHYGFVGLSVFAMLTLLLSLIAIYLALSKGEKTIAASERWSVHIPFSIYLGWVTVAMIANVTAFFDFVGWNGFGISPENWLYIMLIVAVGIAGAVAYSHRDISYLLVLVWAFVGIGVEQADTPAVAMASNIAAGFVVILIVLVFIRNRRLSRKPA